MQPASEDSRHRAPEQGHHTTANDPADRLIRAWENAYRKYAHANEMVAVLTERDPAAAWEMAATSAEVARTWRDLASARNLQWWIRAAVQSAAAAFESQARYWEEKEQGEDGS
jgi:hypothetical protein